MSKIMEKMILTNETDMYTFFEVIDRTEAVSILDVGMFLKRIGSVSRQVMDREIPREKKLIGVDLFPETSCPVWNTIYDSVFDAGEFFLPRNSQTYELAMVLQSENTIDEAAGSQMWSWLSAHVSYILTDWNMDEVRKSAKFKSDMEITTDNKSYRFITL